MPWDSGQERLGHGRGHDLHGRPRSCCDPEGEGAVLVRRGPRNHRKDHAKARARDAKAHEDLQYFMLPRCDGVGRHNKPDHVKRHAKDDRFAVLKLFSNRAEDRLANALSEVLDRDGETEFRTQPAVLFGNWDLE